MIGPGSASIPRGAKELLEPPDAVFRFFLIGTRMQVAKARSKPLILSHIYVLSILLIFISMFCARADSSDTVQISRITGSLAPSRISCSMFDPFDIELSSAKSPPVSLALNNKGLAPNSKKAATELFNEILRSYQIRGMPIAARLKIENSSQVNAFVLRESEIVVTTPLLYTVLDRSELAFIFAHEMAHIALHHNHGSGVRAEIAADRLALFMVTRLGFNPCAGATVLDRLAAPLLASLVSISPRLQALHENAQKSCG